MIITGWNSCGCDVRNGHDRSLQKPDIYKSIKTIIQCQTEKKDHRPDHMEYLLALVSGPACQFPILSNRSLITCSPDLGRIPEVATLNDSYLALAMTVRDRVLHAGSQNPGNLCQARISGMLPICLPNFCRALILQTIC